MLNGKLRGSQSDDLSHDPVSERAVLGLNLQHVLFSGRPVAQLELPEHARFLSFGLTPTYLLSLVDYECWHQCIKFDQRTKHE
jgi:hypothetical protein